MSFASLGLDLSTKATGFVLLGASGTNNPILYDERVISRPNLDGIARAREIVLEIMERITQTMPDRIVIEGYSLSMKNPSSVIPLVELGGLLRFMLKIDGHTWLAPRAAELKKFVTGSGNSEKNKMMMHVLKRWGHESKSNDTADAYGLACIGLAHANKLPGCTEIMRGVVGNLKTISN